MEKTDAAAALSALAQENRLDVFRLLIEAGPDGLPAGQIAATLGLAPNTLTFHFDRLRGAGLVTVRREGRSMIYAARFETMNALIAFLTDNCCGGSPEKCMPRPPACLKRQSDAKRNPRRDRPTYRCGKWARPELPYVFARLREASGASLAQGQTACCYALSKDSVLLRALDTLLRIMR